MKTLTSPVETQTETDQSGWAELYDFYLKASITTPFGVTDVIRITQCPGNLSFFTPLFDPEPEASQGDAATYTTWNVRRKSFSSSSKAANDKVAIAASNVTGEWAEMLADVDWYDVLVVVRKVSLTLAGTPTANDCVTVFRGKIDSARVTLEQLQFSCSNDFCTFGVSIPREDMHTNCRAQFGDDLCTIVKLKAENYKLKTVGSGSTTTVINSSGLTEDTGAATYGTDRIDPLNDGNPAGAITQSSFQSGYEGYRVRTSLPAGDHWRFANNPGDPNPSIDLYSPFLTINFGSAVAPVRWVITEPSDASLRKRREITFLYSTNGTDFNVWQTFTPYFQGQGASRTTYEVLLQPKSAQHWRLVFRMVDNSPFLDAVIGKVSAYSGYAGGTDLVNALSDTAYPGAGYRVSGSDEKAGNEAVYVQTGLNGSWKLNAPAREEYGLYDWGNNYQGYWEIFSTSPNDQSGLANPKLKPHLTFDFGTARKLSLWRFKALAGVERQDIPRLVLIFSADDSGFTTNLRHETYFEIPPRPGEFFDCLIPEAATRRYWRVCVRSTWAEALSFVMFNKVQAYAEVRNYWAHGRIRFADNTATAALRGVSAAVLSSYAGLLNVSPLPVAPASGDTFTVQRGCSRLFNACCERRNWENFAGFTTLPNETVVR